MVNVTNGNPDEMVLVIAPHYHAFREWCDDNGVNPHARNARLVNDTSRMRGYRDARYVFIDFPDGNAGLELAAALRHAKQAYGFRPA